MLICGVFLCRFFRQELTNFMYNVWATITLLGRVLLIKNFKLGSKRVTCCRRGRDAVRYCRWVVFVKWEGTRVMDWPPWSTFCAVS